MLLKEIRHSPLLWLLAFVSVVFTAAKFKPAAHTLLFVLSVLARLSLAPLLSHATESVAAKMDLQFWPGAVVKILISTLTACLVTNGGRSAWFVGVLVLLVHLNFAMTLYLLPPRAQ